MSWAFMICLISNSYLILTSFFCCRFDMKVNKKPRAVSWNHFTFNSFKKIYCYDCLFFKSFWTVLFLLSAGLFNLTKTTDHLDTHARAHTQERIHVEKHNISGLCELCMPFFRSCFSLYCVYCSKHSLPLPLKRHPPACYSVPDEAQLQ